MASMTDIRQLLQETKGATAIEFAIIVAIGCGFIWGAWQVAEVYRQQNHLNIETAALAEILVNRDETAIDPTTDLTISVPLESTLASDTIDAAKILQTAMKLGNDEKNSTVSIEVEYADTATAGTNGTPVVYRYTSGAACPKVENDTSFESLFYENGGRMTPAGDITPVKILRVKSCISEKSGGNIFRKLLMPTTLSSAFTAIRKNNEIE